MQNVFQEGMKMMDAWVLCLKGGGVQGEIVIVEC